MLFSSNIFVFIFLPIVLLIYYGILRRIAIRNIFLFAASLFFYAWGEPYFVLIMLLSIVVNYFFGIWVYAHQQKKQVKPKAALVLTIIFNLSLLFVFKYLGFFIVNINQLFSTSLHVPEVHLPIGISFFTFQAMSYVIDIYRGQGNVQKNPLNVGLYISLFPQLVAGPIIRYNSIEHQIKERKETFANFSSGVYLFTIGFAKKILLANPLAILADKAFTATPLGDLSVSLSWLGAIAYTMQIYYDFSGYSDMAIGLGRMFGFNFGKNFDYPYISKSITEFWRRWHISLGQWFRDYVYFPLGGSKGLSKRRIIINLFIVWSLTGIWHGASWNFVLWGLFYFALLCFEKFTFFGKYLNKREISKTPSCLLHLYTMLCVMLGWVLFRADNLGHALKYMLSMFGLAGNRVLDPVTDFYLGENIFYLLAASLLATPIIRIINTKIDAYPMLKRSVNYIIPFIMAVIFLVCISYLVKGTYNPFIYFNF